jgi:hypothetical protein
MKIWEVFVSLWLFTNTGVLVCSDLGGVLVFLIFVC